MAQSDSILFISGEAPSVFCIILGSCSDSGNKFEGPQAPRDFSAEHLENAFIFTAKKPILNDEITCATVQLEYAIDA